MPEKAVKNMTIGEIGYPDISTKAPNGSKYYENVGKVTKQGFPIARERKALERIEDITGYPPGFTPLE
jgi:hypothetical protein